MTKNRGIYRKSNGNKCPIKWHNHTANECPGRARIMCKICGKSLISHKTFDFCDGNRGEPRHVIDELGVRRKARG